MSADFHSLEIVLLPEFERRRVLLTHDVRFRSILFDSEHPSDGHHFWKLHCLLHDGRTDWKSLAFLVSMFDFGDTVCLEGQVVWHFHRAYGKMPRPGLEYSSGFRGAPGEMIPRFIGEVPALFRAFDRVVSRCSPPSRFSQFMMSSLPFLRRRYFQSLSYEPAT
jgi:hypothetical protein